MAVRISFGVQGYHTLRAPTISRIISVKEDSEFFERAPLDSDTRGHRYKLAYSNVRINVRQRFFAARIIPVSNSLSPSVVEAESISCFKTRPSKENLTTKL